MAVKKTTTKAAAAKKETVAKTVKAEPVKAAETAVKAEPAKASEKEVKAEAAKAIETKKDTTKKLETKAGVLVDTPAAEEKKATAAKKTTASKTTAKKAATKTAAKKTTTAKTAAKKTTATKKTAAKKAEIKTEMFLQFAGKEYSQEELYELAVGGDTTEEFNLDSGTYAGPEHIYFQFGLAEMLILVAAELLIIIVAICKGGSFIFKLQPRQIMTTLS